MKFYYFAACRFCQRVLTTIDELNIRSHLEFLDIQENPKYGDELERLNGTRQVPCLVVDGKPMLESLDIIAFLNKKFKK